VKDRGRLLRDYPFPEPEPEPGDVLSPPMPVPERKQEHPRPRTATLRGVWKPNEHRTRLEAHCCSNSRATRS
jgi:hypothetical protein